MLGVDDLGFAARFRIAASRPAPSHVARRLHRDRTLLFAEVAEDDDLLDARGLARAALSTVLFSGTTLPRR